MLSIHRDTHPEGIAVCRAIGELDAFTVSQLREALAELAASPRLVIDLSAVTFVDSAGLGALIGGIRRTRELGGDVAVACDRPVLIRLLRTTGFDRIVGVAETVDGAAWFLAPSEKIPSPPATAVHSVRRAAAVVDRAAQPAGRIAPAAAITSPPSPRGD